MSAKRFFAIMYAESYVQLAFAALLLGALVWSLLILSARSPLRRRRWAIASVALLIWLGTQLSPVLIWEPEWDGLPLIVFACLLEAVVYGFLEPILDAQQRRQTRRSFALSAIGAACLGARPLFFAALHAGHAWSSAGYVAVAVVMNVGEALVTAALFLLLRGLSRPASA